MKRRDFMRAGVAAMALAAIPAGVMAATRRLHPSFYEMPLAMQESYLGWFDVGKPFFTIPLEEAYFEDQGIKVQHYAIEGRPPVEFSRSWFMYKQGDPSRKVYANPGLTERSPHFWAAATEADLQSVRARGYVITRPA